MTFTIPRNLALYGGLLGVAVVGLAADSRIQSDNLKDAEYSARVKSCRYDNLFRAEEHLEDNQAPPENVRVQTIFRILNCDQTVRKNKGVPLSQAEQTYYIALVNKGLFPTVVKGKVVGAERFPPAAPVEE